MCKGLYRGLEAKNDAIKLLSGIALVGSEDFEWVTKRGGRQSPADVESSSEFEDELVDNSVGDLGGV